MRERKRIFTTFAGTRKRTPRSDASVSGLEKLDAANEAERAAFAKPDDNADRPESAEAEPHRRTPPGNGLD
jgi:hypothetical protein